MLINCSASRTSENVWKLSDEEITATPSESTQDIAKLIRDATENRDVTTRNAIAKEIKNQSDLHTV